ncbi:MAG: cell wall-binding repeat-containing protein [Peptostreptococcus sp.]|uniref:cell wall-binding repeat-containing protein n=1 Tax=Peptostreptococcus sp. TaxID=1262 RepID=UPI002FC62B32
MRRLFALFLSLAIMVSSATLISSASEDLSVRRISGADRYQTPIKISQEYFNQSDIAIVASGESFADALMGGTLSAQGEFPLYLVSKNSVKAELKEELKRINVKQIFLLGGKNSISSNVESSLSNMGISVERISGKDRFETAEKVQGKRLDLSYGDIYYPISNVTSVVSSKVFADALVATPMIVNRHSKVEFARNDPNYSYSSPVALVFGGKSSVNIEEKDYTLRISGEDRYETAVKVADQYKNILGKNIDTVILVNGQDYPDALSSALVSTMNNAAILLSESEKLNEHTEKYIKENNIKNVIIVGGQNSISKSVEKELSGKNIEENIDSSVNGWIESNSNRYYFVNGNKKKGWNNIDGNRYYFNNDGVMQTGWIYDKYFGDGGGRIHDSRYFVLKDGTLAPQWHIEGDWGTTEDGVSVLVDREVGRKKVLEYIEKNESEVYQKIKTNEYTMFGAGYGHAGFFDRFYISKTKDYTKFKEDENGAEGSSTNPLMSFAINVYSGEVKKETWNK